MAPAFRLDLLLEKPVPEVSRWRSSIIQTHISRTILSSQSMVNVDVSFHDTPRRWERQRHSHFSRRVGDFVTLDKQRFGRSLAAERRYP